MCAQPAEKRYDVLDQAFEQISQQRNVDIGHRTLEDRVWRTGDFGFLSKRLIKFMEFVLYTKEVPFRIEWVRGRRKVKEASHLAAYYRCFHHLMDLYWKEQSYSPDLDLFFECYRSHPKIGYCAFQSPKWRLEDGVCEADVFNEFVTYLREQALVQNTKKRMSDWKAVIKDEKKSIRRTVEKLRQFSKILAVRVDLNHRVTADSEAAMRTRTAWEQGDAAAWSAKEDIERERAKYPENRARIDAEIALRARERFFANQSGAGKQLFEHMVGYIIKMERSDDGPYHFHCLFFFDGQKVQSIKYWVMKITEYWKYVTEGNGYVYDCHANPKRKDFEERRRWVVGKIQCRDVVKLRALAAYASWYFAKDEQRVRMKPKSKSRMLTMGMVKKQIRRGGCKKISGRL